MNALVVDDQPSTLMLISAILMRAGYRVVEYMTGESAIEALRHDSFELVILDINLPDMSGMDVLRDARLARHRLPPIIGITAALNENVRDEALAAGMCLVLQKPISYRELTEAAAVAISIHESMERADGGFPVIDRVTLSAVQQLGKDLTHKFVNQTLVDAQRCLQDIREAGMRGDLHAWRQAAHTLDGLALTIGARRLSNSIDSALHTADERLRRTSPGLASRFSELLDEAQHALGEWLDNSGTAPAPSPPAAQNGRLPQRLSGPEIAVLRRMANGKSPSEIADALSVPTREVNGYITSAMSKLDAGNKTQALVKAVMLGLLKVEELS